MNNHYIERAHHLLLNDRMAEAETELRKALSANPREAMAFALLAECAISRNDFSEAVELAKQAVAIDPGNSLYYYVLGKSCFYDKDIPSSRLAIQEGQRMDPDNPQFFLLRGRIEFYQKNWETALNESNRGLELDPEHIELVNLRAQALIKLNRRKDASTTMDYALHKAPENSYSHANKGWVSIESDHYNEAIQSFLESLRLDPENSYAKEGLKEAIKGKNPAYRMILKYFLWMNKLQEKNQWAFIIGIYLLYQVVLQAADKFPSLAPLLYPVIVIYILFAFSTWIAKPISNLFLRLHPIGKHALSNDEILGSNLAGGTIIICLLSFLYYFISGHELGFRLGIVTGILLIPIGGTFSFPPHLSARKGLTAYAGILAIAGLSWVAFPDATVALGIFAIGIFAYGFVTNYLITKANKEFH